MTKTRLFYRVAALFALSLGALAAGCASAEDEKAPVDDASSDNALPVSSDLQPTACETCFTCPNPLRTWCSASNPGAAASLCNSNCVPQCTSEVFC